MSGWDGIDEFVAVATTGSFAGAATAMDLSRTHMSRTIAALEDRLQVRLFNRTTRKVKLTAAGEVFYEQCQRLVMDRDEAIGIVSERGDPQGEFSITCSTALGERFIAPLARVFSRRFPKVRLHLDLSNRVMDLVAEGYDLAIRTGHLPTSSLIATRIAERRLHTCAAPEYLARAGTPDTLEALDRHDCLVGTSTLWHFTHGPREAPGEPPREVLYKPTSRWRCNNGQVVLEAALDGMGLCQLPDFYVNEALRSGRLVAVLEAQASPVEPIWAVYPSRRHLSPKVAQFVRLLKAELPALLAR
ncbi:MAG TPA: LysR family transcriptional regulator [Novosphingobium sp.]|nr:LysR family transcriptional regulator [Novosphingobium sp.]